MLDAVLIKECADPSLKPAIVEQFAAASRAAIDAGFLLEADGDEIEALGAAAWPAP